MKDSQDGILDSSAQQLLLMSCTYKIPLYQKLWVVGTRSEQNHKLFFGWHVFGHYISVSNLNITRKNHVDFFYSPIERT